MKISTINDSTVIIPKAWLSRLLTKDDLQVLGLLDDRSDFEKHSGDNLLIQITSHVLTKMEDLEEVSITKGQLNKFLELKADDELRKAYYLKYPPYFTIRHSVFFDDKTEKSHYGQMVGFDAE